MAPLRRVIEYALIFTVWGVILYCVFCAAVTGHS